MVCNGVYIYTEEERESKFKSTREWMASVDPAFFIVDPALRVMRELELSIKNPKSLNYLHRAVLLGTPVPE